MRTATAGELASWRASHNDTFAKLELEDPDGNWVDVSTGLDDPDWLNSVTLEEDIDANCMTMTAMLLRDTGIDSLLSLAPLREDSTLNVDGAAAYAPFLDVARKWRVSVSVGDHGAAASYTVIGEGLIDTVEVNDPDPTIRITGRDYGASMLDRYIDTVRTYSSGGADSMETVIQDMLDDNLTSAPTLSTPSSPSFVMNKWEQQEENLMVAINKVAHLAGFVCRYRYDSSDNFNLTLYAPNRAASSEDWTLTADEYTALPMAKIDVAGIRNRVIVKYFDDSTKAITTHTESDATSIARYGGPHSIPRVLLIDVSRETNVTTAARANSLAEAILSDLKDPAFDQQFVVPGMWFVQLGDYGLFEANGVHYDTDQNGAVTRIQHRIEAGRLMTTIWVRGQPSARYREWIRYAGKLIAIGEPIREPIFLSPGQGTTALRSDGGVEVNLDGPEWTQSWRYATSTSTLPSLATVRASGTTIDGQSATFTAGAATVGLGDIFRVTAIPYSLPSAGGYEGPAVKLRSARHDVSTTKTLRLSYTQFVSANPDVDDVNYGIGFVELSAKAGVNFFSWVPLPQGASLTAWRFRGTRVNGNGGLEAALYEMDTDGTATLIDGAIQHSTTGYQTVSSTFAETIGTNSYIVLVFIDTVLATNANDNKFLWVEFSYTASSHVQTI